MTTHEPFNWKKLEKYLNSNLEWNFPDETIESFKIKTEVEFKEKVFGGWYREIRKDVCMKCEEINYLIQMLGYFEKLPSRKMDKIFFRFEHYLDHLFSDQPPWRDLADTFNPEPFHLINHYKGMVLAEKFLKPTGGYGSATPAATIFTYLEEKGLVTPSLLDWTFKNRNNAYIPFRCSRYDLNIQNYEDFRIQYIDDSLRAARHDRMLEEDKKKSQILKNKHIVENALLLTQRKIKTDKIYLKLNAYLKTKPDILNDILHDKFKFHIYLIPHDIIDEIISKIDDLCLRDLRKIFNLIPHKAPTKFRVLRIKIREKLKKGLPGFLTFLNYRSPLIKEENKWKRIFLIRTKENKRFRKIIFRRNKAFKNKVAD